jgi:hypothetical protein
MESLPGVALGAGVAGGADGSGVAVAEGDGEADGSFDGSDERSIFAGCSGVGAGELSCR